MLHFALGAKGKIAAQAGNAVEQLAQRVFETTTHIVASIDLSNRTTRRVESLHGVIARGADRFCDALIDCVVCIKRQDFLPVASKITSLNGTPRSCWSSSSNQGMSWSTGACAVAGGADSGRTFADCAQAPATTAVIATNAMNFIQSD